MAPRLTACLWVAAYMARLRLASIPVYLARRGDETAGSVMVKLATLDGRAQAFSRRWDFESDTRLWERLVEGAEAEVDARLAIEATRDPDLWVVELEDRLGRTLLDEDGLAEG